MNITVSRTAPLYVGTDLTFTCTIALDQNVDNNEMIVIEWNGLQGIPQERYSVTNASGSGNIYTGTLTISPLADQDDGVYTCMVTVTGGTNVQHTTASDAVDSITVMSKFNVCGG